MSDTIAAIATAPGRGGIGIVRLSGPAAKTIGEKICQRQLQARLAQLSNFHEEQRTIDQGIALFFPAPNSFTGEDVVELQGHGGPVILDLIVRTACSLGARPARPGEFSERAFLNDKLDLAQAEAVADLIASTTESAARGAMRSLQGDFSHAIDKLIHDVVSLRVFVEAAIDFPEEEVDFIGDGEVANRLSALKEQLALVQETTRQGTLLREGMKLVIAGRPNAGKSSLLNALTGQDNAIVTAIEGTTRDVLREHIQIDGMPLHIVDTAGLRESADLVEQEGIRRAWTEMQTADLILLVIDGSAEDTLPTDADTIWPELHQHLPPSIPVTLVHNKCDLTMRPPSLQDASGGTVIELSAKSGEGLDLLRSHLKEAMGYRADVSTPYLARRRHLVALSRASEYLDLGQAQLDGLSAPELLAEDLRHCHDALGEITGSMSSDELLGEIFSSFCIGK